jgi:DNA-binding MarR family transcriptional regulator
MPSELFADHPNTKRSLSIWLRLYRSVSTIERELQTRLSKQFGVSLSRFDVLSQLARTDDGLTMGELSGRLLVSNGNVTGLISRLVEAGLVSREASPGDRRSFRVQLTISGRDSFAEMAQAHETWVAEILGELDEKAVTALNDNIEQLLNNTQIRECED